MVCIALGGEFPRLSVSDQSAVNGVGMSIVFWAVTPRSRPVIAAD